jgi:fused signal recognition particle receptor
MKKKLGQRIRCIFERNTLDETFFEEFEDALIEADIGSAATMEISDELREAAREEKISTPEELSGRLKQLLGDKLLTGELKISADTLSVYLILGVNGVGKTTTLAKMGSYVGNIVGMDKVIFAAADTFRAAAIDQLQLHGSRLGIRVVAQQPGSDPGAVIWDSLESARAHGTNAVLVDTAGRMHNKANLIKELQKIDKVVHNRAAGAVYKKILVLDATTGQNAFRQAELFHEAVDVDYAVLTKYDSSSKGGIAVTVSDKLGIPFVFLGVGEKYEDLHPFTKDEYLEMLLS